jgi:hypothetical protein
VPVICTKGLPFHLTAVVNIKFLLTAVLLTTSTLVSRRHRNGSCRYFPLEITLVVGSII